jgi:hypothetical protein
MFSSAGRAESVEDGPHIETVSELFFTEAFEQFMQKLAIEVRAIDLLEGAAIALLSVTDQIRIETARPSDAALEERRL